MENDKPRLPAGHPPWEPINGIRIGGVAGLLVGALVAVIATSGALAIIIAFTIVGAVAGYVVAKRRMQE